MVPGNGGDWMQPGGELVNPYWGSEMLTCGEVVRDLAVGSEEVGVRRDRESGRVEERKEH